MSGIEQHDCEHDWESRTRGGEPLAVRICRICRTVDWDDLREQHERAVTERAEKEAESATREATAALTELAPSSLLARAERAEDAIQRVRLVERSLWEHIAVQKSLLAGDGLDRFDRGMLVARQAAHADLLAALDSTDPAGGTE